jgi:hypothetical protein
MKRIEDVLSYRKISRDELLILLRSEAQLITFKTSCRLVSSSLKMPVTCREVIGRNI